MGWFPDCFAAVRSVAGDKAMHFLLVGNLALLLNLSLPWATWGPFPCGSLTMFCVATVEEFSQLFFENRTFDLSDLMSNYLGIIVLGSLGWWLRRRFSNVRLDHTPNL